MKTCLVLMLAGLVFLAACQQPAEVAPNEDVTLLQEQFQGQYKPLQAVGSLAVDVNQDGKATTDMLEEISELSDIGITVIIPGKNQYNPRPSFLFIHHWPKQWLGRVEPADYDPSIKLSYDRKVVSWAFAFDGALTQLQLEPQPAITLSDPDLYTPPQSVLVKGNGRIEVTLTRRLYTTAGWKNVQIVTLYERFTRET